jgi:hypothetical protein
MARPKAEEAKGRKAHVGVRVTPWVRAGLDKIAKQERIQLSDLVDDLFVAYSDGMEYGSHKDDRR